MCRIVLIARALESDNQPTRPNWEGPASSLFRIRPRTRFSVWHEGRPTLPNVSESFYFFREEYSQSIFAYLAWGFGGCWHWKAIGVSLSLQS